MIPFALSLAAVVLMFWLAAWLNSALSRYRERRRERRNVRAAYELLQSQRSEGR